RSAGVRDAGAVAIVAHAAPDPAFVEQRIADDPDPGGGFVADRLLPFVPGDHVVHMAADRDPGTDPQVVGHRGGRAFRHVDALDADRVGPGQQRAVVAVLHPQRAFDIAEAGRWGIDQRDADGVDVADVLDRHRLAHQVPRARLAPGNALDPPQSHRIE